MKKIILGLVLGVIFFSPANVFSTDFQVRLLLHKQAIFEQKHLGIAGWFVVPDISTNKPLKNLLVAGPCYKDSLTWVELMAGAFITGSTAKDDSRKPTEFVINLRAQRQHILACDLYIEVLYRRSDPVIPINITRRIFSPLPGAVLSAGPECDWFTKKRELRYGTRVTVKYLKIISLSAAYQFAKGEDILRIYCLLNL